ncbi:MAG: TonB-dependent receptor, partial [Odoribacter sp.]|nr:TonB-dependent receptor [Odoribacter sp.]
LNAANGSKVNFFGFKFRDQVNYKAISNFNWNSYGGGTNFILIPGNSPVLVQGNVAFSKYVMAMQEEGQSRPDTSEISGFNLGMNFTYFIGKNEIKYGVEMNGFKTDFNFYNALNRHIQQKDFTTELGAFVKSKIIKGKFIIEPSFRTQWYASLSTVSPEPRLALKYNMTRKLRFKFAGGWYSQNLISANSDRDVVNLFYGFLSGPETLPDEFDGNPVKHKLQKAWHTILGTEIDVVNNLTMNIEGYFKKFTQLTNINRNKIFDDSPENSDKPDYLKKDFIIETGDAYGFDVSLKYEFSRIYVWGVYSYGKIHRYDGIAEYVPHYDRRHNINLVGSYKMGKNLNWEFDVRWNLGSGFPYTPSQGYYEQITFADGINTDYTTTNGTLGIQYGDLNSKRLPYYHRLDLTLKRTWEFNDNVKLEVNVGVTNAYNRENMFYFDRIKFERVNQLPIMPSIGINMTF